MLLKGINSLQLFTRKCKTTVRWLVGVFMHPILLRPKRFCASNNFYARITSSLYMFQTPSGDFSSKVTFLYLQLSCMDDPITPYFPAVIR